MSPARGGEPGAAPAGGGRLALRLDRQRYRPGEAVRGSVAVIEGRASGEIRVSLSLHERSTEYEALAATIPGGTLHRGELAPGSAHSFAIELPSDALPSYRTRHGELWWTVNASAGDAAANVATRRIEVESPASPGERSGAGSDLAAGRPPPG